MAKDMSLTQKDKDCIARLLQTIFMFENRPLLQCRVLDNLYTPPAGPFANCLSCPHRLECEVKYDSETESFNNFRINFYTMLKHLEEDTGVFLGANIS